LIRLDEPVITLNLKSVIINAIILGSIITLFTILALSINPLSKYAVIASIGTEITYCVYIFAWSRMGAVYIDTEDFLMTFDLSGLYLIILPVPILVIIRTAFNYRTKIKEAVNIAFLLEIIKNNNTNSLFKIKRVIRKRINNMDLRKSLSDNLEYYIKLLLKGNFPLVEKTNRFTITKKGKKCLDWIKANKKINLQEIIDKKKSQPVFRVWTEEDLEKLKK